MIQLLEKRSENHFHIKKSNKFFNGKSLSAENTKRISAFTNHNKERVNVLFKLFADSGIRDKEVSDMNYLR
jgi:hypothetical protein